MTRHFPGGATPDKGSPCPPQTRPAGFGTAELPAGPGATAIAWRPPSDGLPVQPADHRPPSPDDCFELTYCDETFRFAGGSWGRFGRDDDCCEIPIWTEINDVLLSRVAGEIWCTGPPGQPDAWVRNLSGSHELVVRGHGRPQWLARREPGTRGAACSVPEDGAVITAPSTGDWALRVRRLTTAAIEGPQTQPVSTIRVGPVPDRFAAVAEALCAPLLGQGDAAATYDEIAHRLGISRRQARRYVEQLCDHYRAVLPAKVLPLPADGTPTYQPLATLLVARGLVGAR